MNRQLSLLERQRLTHPDASDADHVVGWASEVIDELALKPPIDPAIVASYLGVAHVEADDIDVAGCLICDRQQLVIKVRRSDPTRRRRFTICHECSHTFFPGFFRQPQYRCQPTARDRQGSALERLCDVGASELLLPRRYFEPALRDAGFGIETVVALSGQFDASLEATAHRIVTLASEPTLLVVLEVARKPSETANRSAIAKLRVQYSWSRGHWPYVRRHKSVSDGTPLARVLEGEIVHETTDLDEIVAEPLSNVDVSARLFPYGVGGLRTRVIALVRPHRRAHTTR